MKILYMIVVVIIQITKSCIPKVVVHQRQGGEREREREREKRKKSQKSEEKEMD